MKKLISKLSLLCFYVLLCLPNSLAQEIEFPAQQEVFKPSPIPDRIILTWDGDPATTQAVTWRTDTSVEKAVAQIAAAGHGPDFEAQDYEATTSKLETDLWTVHYHSVTFKNLQAETLYTYRVGDGNNWSEWFHFRTASSTAVPFTFLYFGDVQNDIKKHGSRVIREAFRYAPDAQFIAFGGDLVDDGTNDLQWGEFFSTGSWYYSMVPLVPAPGNHEYKDKVLTKHWHAQFTLPQNGIEGLEESSYWMDFQGVRFIILNCVRMQDEQVSWLEHVLEDNSNNWTVAIFHYPLFTLRPDRTDNSALIKHWKPLFEKYGVDLVLTGHDHAYGRSGIIDGTVYVSSVTGAKQRDLNRQPWMERSGEKTQFFQVIRIDGDRLTYESRTATGELYDCFELSKQAGEGNQLVNRIPDQDL